MIKIFLIRICRGDEIQQADGIYPSRSRFRSGHNTRVHRSANYALQVPVLFYGPLQDTGLCLFFYPSTNRGKKMVSKSESPSKRPSKNSYLEIGLIVREKAYFGWLIKLRQEKASVKALPHLWCCAALTDAFLPEKK